MCRSACRDRRRQWPGGPCPTVARAHRGDGPFRGGAALDGVDFRMFPGEVHSLMGENGAGKSTLIKAITGALPLESAGVLRLDGAAWSASASPHDAQVAGISTVYQEIDLLPNVSVAENIALGREPRRFGLIDWRGMRRRRAAVLHELGLDIDPASILGTPLRWRCSSWSRSRGPSPPTSRCWSSTSRRRAWTSTRCAELFRVIRDLKQRGVAILFVSHFLDQVYEICDRVTVLRDGRARRGVPDE